MTFKGGRVVFNAPRSVMVDILVMVGLKGTIKSTEGVKRMALLSNHLMCHQISSFTIHRMKGTFQVPSLTFRGLLMSADTFREMV